MVPFYERFNQIESAVGNIAPSIIKWTKDGDGFVVEWSCFIDQLKLCVLHQVNPLFRRDGGVIGIDTLHRTVLISVIVLTQISHNG